MTILSNGMSNKGYAASMARHLRLIVAREQSNWPSPGPNIKDRWRALEAYATFVLEAGDDDPGVTAIWRCQGASLRPSETFEPGGKLQTAISNDVSKRPDECHAKFVAAAIEDLAAATESRIRGAAGPELDRARRDLQFAQEALERERIELRRLSDDIIDKDRILGIAETERRALHEKLKKLLEGTDQGATGLEETEDADLSAATVLPGFPGVYVRQMKDNGALVFAARWPKPGAPGKSESKAGFATPQEAQAYRERMVGDDPKAAQQAAEEATEERRQREAAEARHDVALVQGALAKNPGMNQATAEKLVGIGSAPTERGGRDDD